MYLSDQKLLVIEECMRPFLKALLSHWVSSNSSKKRSYKELILQRLLRDGSVHFYNFEEELRSKSKNFSFRQYKIAMYNIYTYNKIFDKCFCIQNHQRAILENFLTELDFYTSFEDESLSAEMHLAYILANKMLKEDGVHFIKFFEELKEYYKKNPYFGNRKKAGLEYLKAGFIVNSYLIADSYGNAKVSYGKITEK